MARNGKIARLPLDIRNELNERLSDGESGVKLVKWLNRLEPVQSILKDTSGPRTITEQNLSEWRSGGYQDWLRHEEARQFMEDMVEQAGELDDAADGKSICDRFGALLAVDMARLAKKFLEQETDDEKRWARLKEISKELSRLRRDEHRAVWTWIKRQQWERQCEREEDEAEEEINWMEQQRKRMAAFFSLKQVRAIRKDEESKRIKPNPTKSKSAPEGDITQRREGAKVPAKTLNNQGTMAPRSGPDGQSGEGMESGQIKPNPTKSNQKSTKSPLPDGHQETGVIVKVEGTKFSVEGAKSDLIHASYARPPE